jgi:HEAT repeat protein
MNKGNRIQKYLSLLLICILLVSILLTGCGEPTIEELIEDLQSPRSELRESATESLAEIGTPAVEPLIAVLESENSVARSSAADALGEIGDPRAVEPLIAVLESDGALPVLYSASEALGKIGDLRAVEPLIAILEGENDFTREYAKDALVNIGTPAIEALISRWEYDRYGYALDVLADIGLPAVEPLIAVLEGENALARSWAIGALVQIGTPAVESLIAILESEGALSSVLYILGEIGDPSAVEPLIAALENEPFLTQVRIAKVLKEFSTSEADEAAERYLSPLRLLSVGRGVEEMATYGGSAPHPILILDVSSSDYIDDDTYELLSEWMPASIHDIELVVLFSEYEWVTIETCKYEGGRVAYRKQGQVEVYVFEAQTGTLVAEKVFIGPLPDECSLFEEFYEGSSEKTIQGDRVPFEEIQQWLSEYVEG